MKTVAMWKSSHHLPHSWFMKTYWVGTGKLQCAITAVDSVHAFWLLSVKCRNKWEELTSSLLHKVLLQVIAVNFSSTEDNRLIHLVLLDCSDSILPLKDFNSFRPHLFITIATAEKATECQSEAVMSTHYQSDILLNSKNPCYTIDKAEYKSEILN